MHERVRKPQPRQDRPAPERRAPDRRVLQAKLEVGRADDPLELEADRMADEVLGRIRRSALVGGMLDGEVPATRITRRANAHPAGLIGPDGGPVDAGLEAAIRRSSGEPLDRSTRASMEHGFGADFGAVRIHRNSEVAPRLSATAFTVGTDVHFAPGTYAPGSTAGQRLLGHELAHVVQQGAGARRTIMRKLSGGDVVSLKSTFGDQAAGKLHLTALGQEGAYTAIQAWVAKRQTGKTPPTIDEVAEWYDVKIKQPKAAVKTGGYTFDLTLINTRRHEVGFDDHQNKHQHPQLGELSVYKGGKGESSYGSKLSTVAWHTRTTAPIMVRWLNDLNKRGLLEVGQNYTSSTGEDLFGEGHLFVASATKDAGGKLYGSYHCYPA